MEFLKLWSFALTFDDFWIFNPFLEYFLLTFLENILLTFLVNILLAFWRIFCWHFEIYCCHFWLILGRICFALYRFEDVWTHFWDILYGYFWDFWNYFWDILYGYFRDFFDPCRFRNFESVLLSRSFPERFL